jgi:hypothetical protein
VWTYDNRLDLMPAGDGLLVHFTPAVIHPDLKAGDRLTVRAAAGGTAVADRDGKPLLTWQGSETKAVDPAVAPLLLPSMSRVAGDAAQGWSVVLVDRANTEKTLFGQGDVQAKTLTTTLSSSTQVATQAAVDGARTPGDADRDPALHRRHPRCRPEQRGRQRPVSVPISCSNGGAPRTVTPGGAPPPRRTSAPSSFGERGGR